jgi:hypothetical protein
MGSFVLISDWLNVHILNMASLLVVSVVYLCVMLAITFSGN